MMYQEKLAAAVKVNGKVLREYGDLVALPFGSEFSLLVKNLHSLRVLVSVHIDGTDVTDGNQLIIQPGKELDLERFITNGNFNQGSRFKFIERTGKIEDGPRGIKVEDGLIRITYEFEKQKPVVIPAPIIRGPIYAGPYYGPFNGPMYGSTLLGSTRSVANGTTQACYSSATGGAAGDYDGGHDGAASMNLASMDWMDAEQPRSRSVTASAASAAPENDVGITVGGSQSDQKFVVGAWFETDGVQHSMVLRMKGRGTSEVTEPITVQTKLECPTCGTKNKSSSKFCVECGTSLAIF